jgi:hypothetical protein
VKTERLAKLNDVMNFTKHLEKTIRQELSIWMDSIGLDDSQESLKESLSQYSEKVRESVEEEISSPSSSCPPDAETTSIIDRIRISIIDRIRIIEEKHEKLLAQHNLQKQRFTRLEGLYENLTDRVNHQSDTIHQMDQYLETIASYKKLKDIHSDDFKFEYDPCDPPEED